MRPGRRAAIDVGKVRIGIAISDQTPILASGLATVQRTESIQESVDLVLKELEPFELLEIYVGLPLALSGNVTASTQDAIDFAKALDLSSGCEVRMVDERLTTVSASTNLRNSGISTKNQRRVIDKEAAAIILESALQYERSQNAKPGKAASESA